MSAPPPIRIGMTSNVFGLGSTALAAAHAAHMQGAEFFFFRPEDIDPAGESIEGVFFQGGGWEKKRTPFPDVVENATLDQISGAGWQALVRKCRITTPFLGGKMAVDKLMRDSGKFDDLLVPTATVQSPDQLIDEVARYKKIVVKPEFGGQGRGIIFLAAKGNGFFVNADGISKDFTTAELKAFIARRLEAESHIVQQYVASRTARGQPFDVRVHVRRDGDAEWQHVYSYARIGTGTSIAANLATGGALAKPIYFLKHRFGAAAGKAMGRLAAIATQFPPLFQTLFPGRIIPALGIDVGLDDDGRPRLFEVNSNPSAEYVPYNDHMWRIGYAIYLVNNPGVPDGVVRGDWRASSCLYAGAMQNTANLLPSRSRK